MYVLKAALMRADCIVSGGVVSHSQRQVAESCAKMGAALPLARLSRSRGYQRPFFYIAIRATPC